MGIFLVIGAAAGAALMYINDPEMGSQRRAAVRDQVNKLIHPNDDTPAEPASIPTAEAKYRAKNMAAQERKRIIIEDLPSDVVEIDVPDNVTLE